MIIESVGADRYRGPVWTRGCSGEQFSHWAVHYTRDQQTCNQNKGFGNYTEHIPAESSLLHNESMHVFGVNIDRNKDEVTSYVDNTTVGSVPERSTKLDAAHAW